MDEYFPGNCAWNLTVVAAPNGGATIDQARQGRGHRGLTRRVDGCRGPLIRGPGALPEYGAFGQQATRDAVSSV
ncbi:hypothetical protein [Streptomyces sp. YKOK-I1]